MDDNGRTIMPSSRSLNARLATNRFGTVCRRGFLNRTMNTSELAAIVHSTNSANEPALSVVNMIDVLSISVDII
jgi:hypothetical protein